MNQQDLFRPRASAGIAKLWADERPERSAKNEREESRLVVPVEAAEITESSWPRLPTRLNINQSNNNNNNNNNRCQEMKTKFNRMNQKRTAANKSYKFLINISLSIVLNIILLTTSCHRLFSLTSDTRNGLANAQFLFTYEINQESDDSRAPKSSLFDPSSFKIVTPSQLASSYQRLASQLPEQAPQTPGSTAQSFLDQAVASPPTPIGEQSATPSGSSLSSSPSSSSSSSSFLKQTSAAIQSFAELFHLTPSSSPAPLGQSPLTPQPPAAGGGGLDQQEEARSLHEHWTQQQQRAHQQQHQQPNHHHLAAAFQSFTTSPSVALQPPSSQASVVQTSGQQQQQQQQPSGSSQASYWLTSNPLSGPDGNFLVEIKTNNQQEQTSSGAQSQPQEQSQQQSAARQHPAGNLVDNLLSLSHPAEHQQQQVQQNHLQHLHNQHNNQHQQFSQQKQQPATPTTTPISSLQSRHAGASAQSSFLATPTSYYPPPKSSSADQRPAHASPQSSPPGPLNQVQQPNLNHHHQNNHNHNHNQQHQQRAPTAEGHFQPQSEPLHQHQARSLQDNQQRPNFHGQQRTQQAAASSARLSSNSFRPSELQIEPEHHQLQPPANAPENFDAGSHSYTPVTGQPVGAGPAQSNHFKSAEESLIAFRQQQQQQQQQQHQSQVGAQEPRGNSLLGEDEPVALPVTPRSSHGHAHQHQDPLSESPYQAEQPRVSGPLSKPKAHTNTYSVVPQEQKQKHQLPVGAHNESPVQQEIPKVSPQIYESFLLQQKDQYEKHMELLKQQQELNKLLEQKQKRERERERESQEMREERDKKVAKQQQQQQQRSKKEELERQEQRKKAAAAREHEQAQTAARKARLEKQRQQQEAEEVARRKLALQRQEEEQQEEEEKQRRRRYRELMEAREREDKLRAQAEAEASAARREREQKEREAAETRRRQRDEEDAAAAKQYSAYLRQQEELKKLLELKQKEDEAAEARRRQVAAAQEQEQAAAAAAAAAARSRSTSAVRASKLALEHKERARQQAAAAAAAAASVTSAQVNTGSRQTSQLVQVRGGTSTWGGRATRARPTAAELPTNNHLTPSSVSPPVNERQVTSAFYQNLPTSSGSTTGIPSTTTTTATTPTTTTTTTTTTTSAPAESTTSVRTGTRITVTNGRSLTSEPMRRLRADEKLIRQKIPLYSGAGKYGLYSKTDSDELAKLLEAVNLSPRATGSAASTSTTTTSTTTTPAPVTSSSSSSSTTSMQDEDNTIYANNRMASSSLSPLLNLRELSVTPSSLQLASGQGPTTGEPISSTTQFDDDVPRRRVVVRARLAQSASQPRPLSINISPAASQTSSTRVNSMPNAASHQRNSTNSGNRGTATIGLASLPADSDNDGIPGRAGQEYPVLAEVPQTSFSCSKQPLNGYYADTETACQVVHLCQGGQQSSILCPNGTIFNQEKFSCQWWYEVNCARAPMFYQLNDNLYKAAAAAAPKLADDLRRSPTNAKSSRV